MTFVTRTSISAGMHASGDADVIGGDDDGDGADALACVGFGRFGKTKRLNRKMDGELLVNTEQTSTSSLGVPSP